jgi:hypothetical protein
LYISVSEYCLGKRVFGIFYPNRHRMTKLLCIRQMLIHWYIFRETRAID